jgi:hypothetical protein
MARFTRRSYRRRKLFFGVSLFSSVALISTGFASWIISLNAKGEIGGDVNVGTVTDSSVTIEINREYEDEEKTREIKPRFVFGSDANDTTGRIRNNGVETDYEDLTINVSGKIKNCQYVTSQTIELIVPEGVIKAAEAGYIVLPECVVDGEGDTKTALPLAGTGTEKTFNYDIEFEWGTKFGSMNPGKYFDEDPVGITIDDDTCKKELQDFRAILYGYDDQMNAAGSDMAARDTVAENHKNDEGPVFKVIITAESN